MKYLICFFLFSIVFTSNSQNTPQEICGYQNEVNKRLEKNPNFKLWQDLIYEQALSQYRDINSSKRSLIITDTINITIPVVFHVLYNKSDENLHDSNILNQLRVFNEAFNKTNADTSRIRSIFKSRLGNMKIKFKLVDKDSLGNFHTGINRIFTNKSTFAIAQNGSYSSDMKYSANGGQNAWNPTKYLNIWICNMQYPGANITVLGFATPPDGSPNWPSSSTFSDDNRESGVVLHYKIVGTKNPLSLGKYNEGKSAVHEVGHYLGLRHVWGDGDAVSGCSRDDGIFDTPNARYSNATCGSQNTCTDANNDLPDQTENYMDYTLDGCAAMFTKEQVAVMRYVLFNLRSGLAKFDIVNDTLPSSTSVTIYPNPVFDNRNVNIKIEDAFNENYSLEMYSFEGKRVLNTDKITGNSSFTIDLKNIANSTYFLIIRDKNNKIILKQKLIVI